MVVAVKNLGVGVGLRIPHYPAIFQSWPELDFFEIISENFMVDGGPPLANLARILERYPVVQHGVSLNIAAAQPLDFDYLKRLKKLCRFTGTPWVSDHLCWSGAHNSHYHDLLPVPYTEQNAAFIAEKARIVQDFLELPFALENLSTYVSFSGSEMSEWEFYKLVVETADISMMLDVNNIFVSSVNHQFDPMVYLAALPMERVIQTHVAGHTTLANGTLLDTHDHHVRPEVWSLYGHVHRQTGGVSTILEWDDNFLSFEETLAEVAPRERINMTATTPEQRNRQVKPPEGLGLMQRQFAAAITTPFLFLTEQGDFEVQLEHYPPEIVAQMVEGHGLTGAERLAVYNQQYWFRLFTVMQEEYPTLVGLLGYLELNKLVSCYLQIWPSSSPLLRHLSDHLAEFLRRSDHPWNSQLIQQAALLDYLYIQAFDAASRPFLDAAWLVAVDPADLKLKLQPHCFLYEEDWNLVACRFQLKQEGQGEVEPGPEKGWWMIYRDKKVQAERLGPLQFYLLGFLQEGLSLGDALDRLSEILDEQQLIFLTDNIQGWFTRWTKLNWLAAS